MDVDAGFGMNAVLKHMTGSFCGVLLHRVGDLKTGLGGFVYWFMHDFLITFIICFLFSFFQISLERRLPKLPKNCKILIQLIRIMKRYVAPCFEIGRERYSQMCFVICRFYFLYFLPSSGHPKQKVVGKSNEQFCPTKMVQYFYSAT